MLKHPKREMKPTQAESPTVHPGNNLVPLESVLCTEELNRRPARPPDYETENRALVALAQALADSPRTILQTLVDTILEVIEAGSAGLSLLTKDETRFYWPAIAGVWKSHVGGGTPRNFGPCGDVLDRNTPLLFKRLERRYPYFQPVTPAAEEALLVPFYVGGEAIGTIWALAHDHHRKFDAEDLRKIVSLSGFTSLAYRQSEASVSSLDSRRAALNLMEDAVRSRRTLETLNAELRASEERYRTLFESIDEGFCIIEKVEGEAGKPLDFRYVEANPAFAVQSGTSDVIGKTIRQAFPDISEEWYLTYDAVLRTGEPIRFERSLLPAERVLELYAFRAEDETHRRVAIIFKDITERKRTENALRASEEFNRSIIESSPDCIKILDPEGNLLSMQSGQELLGIEDIRPFLNKSWIDFWEGEDGRAARAAVETAVAGGAGKFVGFFRTLRGEPKWWDVAISPILDANGKPERLLAVSRDVTEHRRAEMHLALLASVSQDLVRLTSVDEMMRIVGAKLAGYLNLSLCAFVEINEAADQAVISHDWHREDVPGLVGVYRLADFVEEAFIRAARMGEILVVRDTAKDLRTDAEKFSKLKIASFVRAPLIRDGQWRFALCLYKSEPYDWREDEIELTREVTERISTRLERLRVDKALRASEERYRTLFSSMDEGYCIIEMIYDEHDKPVDYRYREVNPAFWKQTGLLDVTGKRVRDLAPEHEDHWFEIYGNVALTGEPVRFVNQAKAMHNRWFDVYACRVGEPDSRNVAVVFNDITKRIQSEVALRESEERYRNLFNSMDEGYCVMEVIFDEHEKPVDYRFLEVNLAFEEQSGMHDATGKRIRELVPDIEEYWMETYGKVALTGEAIRFVNEAKTMDASWFDVNAFRLGGPESRKVAVLFRNIKERKDAENALRESEERYRNLFNSMDEGFCIIEMIFDEHNKPVDYRFVEVNPSFEKQIGLHNVTGKRVREIVPDLEAFWFEIYGKVALTGEPIRFTNEVKALNTWLDIYAARLGGSDNRKVAVIFSNITERKESELSLNNAIAVAEKANLAKSDFLSSMSHELRTPLSAILGFAQLMESASPPPTPSQQRSIDQILQAGWYLLEMINEILDLAVIESGKLSLSMEPVSLAEVMVECQTMIEPQAQKRGISVVFPRFEIPYFVQADRIRLKQVLINLLSNAIKYNKVDGTIVVDCLASSAERIRIGVEDTGKGLAPDKLAQLFQPFNRIGQEASIEEGTGIGLVMCKRLVELMKGEIGVESAVGKGSVFWIELNLTAEPQPAAVTVVARAQVHAGAPLHTVLYVEDNPANLMLIEDLVARRPDIRLLSAADGKRGVDIALASRPDVILMDINLPGLSGIQALEILRDIPATAHIPVIALTANAMPRDIEKGLAAGFFRYLTKPIKANEFMETLDVALKFSKTQSAHANNKEKA